MLGNDSITAELYEHCPDEAAPALLDIYDSWGSWYYFWDE